MRQLNELNRDRMWSAASGGYSAPWLAIKRARAEPSTGRVVLAGLLGGTLGALAAATAFPALPALMFGAAIGAYSGFLATAMEALGSGDLPE
jgi:hypothetical protein